MKRTPLLTVGFICIIAVLSMAMGRSPGQYDVEAREAKKEVKAEKSSRATKAATGIAQGVKEVALDSPAGFVTETAGAAREEGPVVGTLGGVVRGTGTVLDKTVRGAVRVATLGQGELESYEVRDPEPQSGDPARITIPLPRS